MIPFHFSSEQARQAVGWVGENCPNCGEVRAFLGYKMVRAWKLFGATVDERTVNVAIVCCFCRLAFALPADTGLQVDTAWQHEDGLQLLVDRTNPALGTVRQRDNPTGQAILGLLRSLEDQRPNFIELLEQTSGLTVALGAMLGGLIFGLLGNLLMYLGPHVDQAWSGTASAAIIPPGTAIGAVVGGIIGGVRIARSKVKQDLEATMKLYNIKCSQLREVVAKEPNSLRTVASMVEALCQTDAGRK